MAGSAPVVGLIGAGNASQAYLRTLDVLVSQGRARAGAVVVRTEAERERLATRHPFTRTVPSLDALLDDGVDLVMITTPPDSHAALSRACLAHGVHVLVEKPLAATGEEARELYDMATANGLLLAAAPFVHLSPAMRLLRAKVVGGAIGDVHSARGLYGNGRPAWAEWYRHQQVGPLGDLAIYNIQSLAFLLGPVTGVRCWESWSTLAGDDDVADVVHLMLDHRDGARSTLMASHAVCGYRRPALELYGAHGTANLLGDDWDPVGIELYNDDWGYWRTYPSPDPTWHWTGGLTTAVSAIGDGVRSGLDPDISLHVIDVLAAAHASAKSEGQRHSVTSCFDVAPLEPVEFRRLHDHTRPPQDQ